MSVYHGLCQVLAAACGLSLVAISRGDSLAVGHGLLIMHGLLLLWNTGSRAQVSVAVVHGLSYTRTHGIFPGQGLNLCSLHWQVDS